MLLETESPDLRVTTLGRETLVYGVAAFVQRFGGFILVPLYGHVFSSREYGVVSLLVVTAGLLLALTSLQLDSAAHRWFFDSNDEEQRASTIATWMWVQLAVSSAVAAVMVWFSAPLSVWIFGTAGEATALSLAALSVPAGVIAYAAGTTMRLQRRPWMTVLIAVLSMSVTVGATVAFVVGAHAGPAGVFAGQIVAGLVVSAVGVLLLRRAADPRYIDRQRLREMMRFAVPLMLLPIAAWVLSSADRYFIERFDSLDAVGVYQMGAVVAAIVALGTISFAFAWSPWALSMHQRAEAPIRYARAFDVYVLAGSLLALLVTFVAEPVMHLIADDAFVGGVAMVPWLAPAHVAAGAVIVGATGAIVAKDARPFGISMYAGAGVTLLLNAALVPWIGMLGGAVATLVAQCVVVTVVFWRSQRKHRFPFRIFRGTVVFGAAAAAGLLGTVGPAGSLIERSALFLVVAVAAGSLLGRPPRADALSDQPGDRAISSP